MLPLLPSCTNETEQRRSLSANSVRARNSSRPSQQPPEPSTGGSACTDLQPSAVGAGDRWGAGGVVFVGLDDSGNYTSDEKASIISSGILWGGAQLYSSFQGRKRIRECRAVGALPGRSRAKSGWPPQQM